MSSPQRGDIYHIELTEKDGIGRELNRPHWWVVLSTQKLNDVTDLFIAVPFSSTLSKKTGLPKDHGNFRLFFIRVLEVNKKPDPGRGEEQVFKGDSIALTHQIRAFSFQRLTNQPRSGVVDDDGLGAIESGLLFVIGAGIRRQTTGPVPAKHVFPREESRAIPGIPTPQKK